MTRKIERTSSNIPSRAGGVGQAVPVGIHPVLRRFWDFARKMAKEFSKHLMKDREEEFLKVVQRDFDKWS